MMRIILAAVLLFPLLAEADDLTAHQRELLLARLEDLAGRLAAQPDDRVPGGFEVRQEQLEAELKAEPGRVLAGVALERTEVKLRGGPDLLLAWLDKIRDSRLALTPPFRLRSTGNGFEFELTAWRVQGDRPDPESANQDLLKLKENLLWVEKQRGKLLGYLALLKPILDVEAVLVRTAKLEKGVITIDAQACDTAAREALIKELAQRAAQISKSIHLDWQGLKVRPEKPADGRGLHMRDLDPADALLLAGEVDRTQVIAAWKEGPALTGHIPGKPGDLLAPLLRRLALPSRKLGAVVVAAAGLSGRPPGAEMLPERPISLEFRRVTPANLFVLLSEVSRVGVIPPASDRILTVLVREMPVRNLAATVLWILGLVPNGDEKLMAALPPDSAPAIRKGEAGGLDLSAAEAPLSRLVDALAGQPGVIACKEDPLLTLRVRDVSKRNLLELLLTGRGMTLKSSNDQTYLVPQGAGLDPKQCTQSVPVKTVDRLYAVVRDQKRSLALVNDGGRLRWVKEGDQLKDGREVRRIRTSRVVLRGTDRKLRSLFPNLESDCPQEGCVRHMDPTATALARFRLAGTAVSGKRAAAALVDERGDVYVVRQGHLLGRRCGRVSRIEPGRIGVEVGCGQSYDPKMVWISLGGE